MLRSPEKEVFYSVDLLAVTHTSLQGQVMQAMDPTWPVFTRFLLRYTALSESQKNEFITFVTNNRGLELTYTDFRGQVWTGCIFSDDVTVAAGRDNCEYSCSFEFEGVTS